ncbi:MAG: hypothetical protein ACFFB0_10000 [Promethearchaeota archaeon]
MFNGEETIEDLKNLLGYMGIEILFAIDKGAKTFETIKLFSGLPMECVRGRIPVLLDLQLIKKIKQEHFLTEKGNNFKKELERNTL